MAYWITVICLLGLVQGKLREDTDKDACEAIKCKGKGYECIDGRCFCSEGYIPNHFQNRCIKCPGLGENCFGACCDYQGNGTLSCWQGICQQCYDDMGNFVCRESLDHIFIISSTQIAMAIALILGIIATFVLIYKLCAAADLRPMGRTSDYGGRLSIGSFQLYINERLRDAPPRYSRTAPSGIVSAAIPATVYMNSGFIHDSTIPPPPYSPPKVEETIKEEVNQQPQGPQATVHI